MLARSRDVAIDEIGASVWTMYMAGRVLPLCQRTPDGWSYLVQATDNGPIRPSIWSEPPTKLRKAAA